MINITDKYNCCGCNACVSICPKHSITMLPDNEGFFYPYVDKNTCVNCNLCEKVCNELHPYDKRIPLKVLAGINNNEEIRLKSSSGGIFYILAEKIISEGGIVFGARFDNNWQVVIDFAENMKDVKQFMGSKYVQARIDTAFKDVKRFLSEGRKVLFSGTPCQVAGLHQFLRKSYMNLLTVDFICHGVPSPKVWEKYLNEVGINPGNISGIEFRNKNTGWKNYSFNLKYIQEGNNVSLLSSYKKNPYMKAFLQDLILRPSCYQCKNRECSSQSDITIADFWGIHSILPNMDDDNGTSLILLNTNKGLYYFDSERIIVEETEYKYVKSLNPACYISPNLHPMRDVFFERLDNENLIDLIHECTKLTFKQKIKKNLGECISLIYRMLPKGCSIVGYTL